MPGRIILLRHGQTYSNISRLLDTRPPGAELTERGRDQATEAGRELAQLVGEREVEFKCSIALRAQQTAMLAARAFEQERGMPEYSQRVDVISGVHEIFAGDWEMDGSEDAHRSHMVAMRGWCDGERGAGMEGGETLVDADFAYTGYLANCRFMVMEPRGKDFGEWTLTRWADTEL